MAEVIGVASGAAGLCTFAFQAGTALYNTIESYQSHQQRVLDLLSENGALNGVLETLQGTLASASDLDLSALEIPLTQCGVACQEIAREIETLTSSSGGRLAKLRGWARLRYMGEDIDGLRRLLAGYKMTITIALADANLYVLHPYILLLTMLTLQLHWTGRGQRLRLTRSRGTPA